MWLLLDTPCTATRVLVSLPFGPASQSVRYEKANELGTRNRTGPTLPSSIWGLMKVVRIASGERKHLNRRDCQSRLVGSGSQHDHPVVTTFPFQILHGQDIVRHGFDISVVRRKDRIYNTALWIFQAVTVILPPD
jgi:hypothetical protein